MSTINFYLDREDSKRERPVFLVYQHKGKKFKFYTGEKIKNRYLNFKKKRARNFNGVIELNHYLEDLENDLKNIVRSLRLEGRLSRL